MKAVLTITVYYDEAVQPSFSLIDEQLMAAANFLADKGLLSGDSENLLVDTWSATVS